MTITPDALDFGESAVGTVTTTNSGSADLVLSDISGLASPFELSGGSCLPTPTTLVPGASCTIEVRFKDGVLGGGTFSDTFTINCNAPSSPDAVAVQGVPGAQVDIPTLDRSGRIVMILMMIAGGWKIRRQA